MDLISSLISSISGYMYGYILIALLIAAGIYFSLRTRFVQIRMFIESIRVISEPKKHRESISSFQALMVSTASRVGTGNIVGVTGAIIMGGAGAVFWMWLIAILGSASAFVESTLAQIYKKKGAEGSYGGPAYYIKQALKAPALGGIFAVFLILTYMGGFNALASFNLADFVKAYIPSENATLYIGAVVAVLSAIVIFGGGRRISRATQIIVPVMALAYIAVALITIFLNITAFPSVIASIFSKALDLSSIAGGAFGAAIMNGIKRGLYSNEAGIGSAPNAAASADVSHPVKQGLVQMLSVFIDTLLICSSSAFMVLCTGLDPTNYLDSSGNAMSGLYIQDSLGVNFGVFGGYFITAALALFAYTTLVGNYYYAEMNISYIYKNALENKAFMFFYRMLAVVIIFIGAQFSAGLAWDTADVLMGCMALINVPVCIILGNIAFRALKDYNTKKRNGSPLVFRASDIGIRDTEYWK